MQIGILGSGEVGQQLGLGFVNLGHAVKIGTRDPKKVEAWIAKTDGRGSAGSFEEAAAFGEIIALATLWAGTENAIRLAGAERMAGKIVIDATNPLDFSQGMPPRLVSAPGRSGGEQVQAWLPESKVVKAFNTIGNVIMCNAPRDEGVPDLLVCGNHDEAKKKVGNIASEWGWASTIDLGDMSQAYLLEAYGMIWIAYGFQSNNWTHAFKLLRH
jgi:8-hydroxy-5-deazaflavin:NADPH oxidoreductase